MGSSFTLLVAIYGAIVASGTLAWNIYRDQFRDRPKLEVYPAIMEVFGETTEHDVLTFRVTNVGSKPIMLTHIVFKLPGTKRMILNVPEIPKKFEPNDYHIYFSREYRDLQTKDLEGIFAGDSVGREYPVSSKVVKKLKAELEALADAGIHRSWFGEKLPKT